MNFHFKDAHRTSSVNTGAAFLSVIISAEHSAAHVPRLTISNSRLKSDQNSFLKINKPLICEAWVN